MVWAMTKHGAVVVPEDAVVAAAAVGRHFSFPPPRTGGVGGDSCKKLAAQQIDLGAAVVGSWLDSMKASSPRHRLVAPAVAAAAADAEHDEWMVTHAPRISLPVHVGDVGLSRPAAHARGGAGTETRVCVFCWWQEKHPSALGKFEALAAAAKGKRIVVFLDYDGTLSPIVEDPDRAVMTDEVSHPPP